MDSCVSHISADREVWRQARSQIHDAENEILELQLDLNERQAAVDSLTARHKSLCDDVARLQHKKADLGRRSTEEMERILASQKSVKEEVQHGEELINLLKGFSEQLEAAKEVQDKQKHLFAVHLRQQEQFLVQMRKFLTGISESDCQHHDMHEGSCSVPTSKDAQQAVTAAVVSAE
ncbi:hypothetical protein COCOBI_14-1950 [Coccomyxa sp. Obi]|nr:hypothetical protein COCOBI_14-1950 [Coccomyxa sp. Obi]